MEGGFLCLHCGQSVALADTNVATDHALCRACGRTMPFSALAEDGALAAVDLTTPPRGVNVSRNLLTGIDLTYRRVNRTVFFLIPFTALWSGLSLGGIYGRQIIDGKFDPAASLAGLPFVIGTVVLLGTILFMLFGRWHVRLDRDVVAVSVGVGPFGWHRDIMLQPGSLVRLEDSHLKVNRVPQRVIAITSGDRTLRFGAGLPPEARHFFAAALRKAVPDA